MIKEGKMAKKNIHKTTGEQFKLFKKECERWIKFWGKDNDKIRPHSKSKILSDTEFTGYGDDG